MPKPATTCDAFRIEKGRPSLKRTLRALKSISLGFRVASAFGLRVSIRSYDARWAKFLSWAVAEVPLDRLRAHHYLLGPMRVEETPHVAFFAGHLSGSPASGGQCYSDYMVQQYGYSPDELKKRLDRSQALLHEYVHNEAKFEILVAPRPDGTFVIVDGFHRAAIVAAAAAERITCRLRL